MVAKSALACSCPATASVMVIATFVLFLLTAQCLVYYADAFAYPPPTLITTLHRGILSKKALPSHPPPRPVSYSARREQRISQSILFASIVIYDENLGWKKNSKKSLSSESDDGNSSITGTSSSKERKRRRFRIFREKKEEPSSSTASAQVLESSKGVTNAEAKSKEDDIVIPSYRTLWIFLSSTVLIWLAEPLLSLVDTTVVGLTCQNSVVQLASLGPATTFYDSLLYMCYFLAIATTNKLAPAFASRNYRELQQTTSHVLGVAAVMGLLVTCVCFAGGPWILGKMVASGGSTIAAGTSELVRYATSYVWIRASVALASVVGMVMQSFCLATLDTKTPFYAVAAASVVNVIGDLALRQYGVQGAAVATAASSVLASGILFGAVRKRLNEWRRLEVEEHTNTQQQQQQPAKQALVKNHQEAIPLLLQQNHTAPIMVADQTHTECLIAPTATAASSAASEEFSSIQTADGNVVVTTAAVVAPPSPPPPAIPFASIPDRKALIDLVKLAGPIFFVLMAQTTCYGAMTLRCTDFGILSLASQSIMLRVFFFCGTFGDALSQTSQSFLPAALYPKTCTKTFRAILQRLLVIATVLAVTNSQAAVLILQRFGQFLANDGSIVRMMADQSAFLGMVIFLHPFINLLEGTVIASRDFRTLIRTYAVTLGCHFTILKCFSDSFSAVWRTFLLFQTIRLANFGGHVWRRQRVFRKQQQSTQQQIATSVLAASSSSSSDHAAAVTTAATATPVSILS